MQHIRYRHVETRPHECPLCHKTYKTTHTLVDHLETHREKCYTCSEPNCFYIATTARNFNHHMRSVHGGELLLYCCHVCNERFSLGRKLTKHLKDQHGFELPPGHSRFRYVYILFKFGDLISRKLMDINVMTLVLRSSRDFMRYEPTSPFLKSIRLCTAISFLCTIPSFITTEIRPGNDTSIAHSIH